MGAEPQRHLVGAVSRRRRQPATMRGCCTAAAAAAILCVAVARPAAAQIDSREAIALQNQILELRRQVEILGQGGAVRPGYGYAAPVPAPVSGGGSDVASQLLTRVLALEEQVRQLRGRIDEMQNTQQQQYADLAKQIADMNFRLQGSGAGAAPPSAGPPSVVPSAPPPAPGAPPAAGAPRRTPEIALQDGNAALARHDYAAAEAAGKEVLAATKGPRATDAQFLLAEVYAGQRNYQQAAVAYDDAFKRAPSGIHAPDSLLGVAVSLNALGAKRESCEALAQLRATFPTPRPDLRDQIAAARDRAGCH